MHSINATGPAREVAATAQCEMARRSEVALNKEGGEDRRAQESAAGRRECATVLATIHACTAALAEMAAQLREDDGMENMVPF